MQEIWKDVVGFEGKYLVSNFGNVASCNYNRHSGLKNLTKRDNGNGYDVVCLIQNGKHKNKYVHRLVASSFIGKIPDGYVVNHKDYNRKNNKLENLEIITQRENILYSIDRMSCIQKKKVARYDKNMNFIEEYDSVSSANKIYGSHVCDACSGKRKTCGGFYWKYC